MRGNIQKRTGPQGTAYRVRIDFTDPATGKRKQRSETFQTRKEAETALTRMLAERDRGTLVLPSTATVKEVLDQWLSNVAATKVKATTLEDYRATVEKHIIPILGTIKVQKLTPARVQAFYAEKTAAGTGTRTVQLCHLRLSQALAWAERMGIVPRNVCAVVEPPTHRGAERTVWTPEQAETFFTAITEREPWHTFFLLIVTTGLRKGEALGLRWQDVDFSKRTVAVRQAIVTLDGKAKIETPKSPAARRLVVIPEETAQALQDHRSRQRLQRMRVADAWADNDLVFCTELGAIIHPSNVNRALTALVEESNVPRITVHELRHTHATWLLSHGLPVKDVSARIGHAKASITLDTYAHIIPGMQDNAVETVRGLLFKKPA